MSQVLRQSTEVIVRIGPAVAVGDGFTPVTTLALSTADEAEALRAAGAATLDISGATFAAITGADGWYNMTLSTTATNTVGTLDIVVNDDSLILPIFARFQVIEEAAFDAIYAASAAPATAAALATVDTNVDDLKSGIIYGAAATGTLSTTQATTNLTGYADDQLIGRVIIWLSGACEGEGTDITDYASASGLLTFTALTTAPGNADLFKIV